MPGLISASKVSTTTGPYAFWQTFVELSLHECLPERESGGRGPVTVTPPRWTGAMPQTPRTTVLELAADQHGLFNARQARSSGLPVAAVRHWEHAGVTERVASGVWRVAGSPRSPEQRAMTAVLAGGPGTALCRSSAAWLWDIPGHRLEPVQVLRTRGDRSVPAGATHTSRLVDDADLTTRRGITTTTPARTLFDLAGRQHPPRPQPPLRPRPAGARHAVRSAASPRSARPTGHHGHAGPDRRAARRRSTDGQQPRVARRTGPA